MSIFDFCNKNGIQLVKDSKKWWHTSEHDSLHINIVGNYFKWSSRGANGDAINFVTAWYAVKFNKAVSMLLEEDYSKTEVVNKKHLEPFIYDYSTESSDFNKAREYLIKERSLGRNFVDFLYKKQLLAQDLRDNVVFIWKWDGKIIGCTEQGTRHVDYLKRGTWKSLRKNSALDFGFNIIFGLPKSIYFFESEIDLLSYVQLNKTNLKNKMFMSMNGLKYDTVIKTLNRVYVTFGIISEKNYLCVDNDSAGLNFIKSIHENFNYVVQDTGKPVEFFEKLPPKNNDSKKMDWNKYLKFSVEKSDIL